MSDPKSAIAATNQAFMDTFEAGDAHGLVQWYTGGAELLPPGRGVVSGHAAIESYWEMAMGMGIARAHLETREVTDHGDLAVEVGRYTLFAADGREMDHGKYILVWKNEGGTWRIHRDMWNTSVAHME